MKTAIGFASCFLAVLIGAYLISILFPSFRLLTPADLMAYAGTVVTVLSFVTGVYFILLAVNSYGVIRDIEGKAHLVSGGIEKLESRQIEAEGRLLSVEKRSGDVHKSVVDIANESANYAKLARGFMDELVAMVDDLSQAKSTNEKQAIRISRFRYRMAFEAEFNQEQKIAFARSLIQLGRDDDLLQVRAFLESIDHIDKATLIKLVDEKLYQLKHRAQGT